MSKLNKGARMEESLRAYFLNAGYFVARGIKFEYKSFDITDIDLWLYGRPSSVSREIVIVDVKNKKTPAAIERIFWVKGLQKAISADGAIVATTDRREEVVSFGIKNDVQVLGGGFISRLEKSNDILNSRLSEEELLQEISKNPLSKLDGDWKRIYETSKSSLTQGLGFDSCNLWLNNANIFAQQVLTNPAFGEISGRLCYLLSSYIAVSLDFLLRELSFVEDKVKRNRLDIGFKYGERGEKGTSGVLGDSLALVEQFADNGSTVIAQVRKNVKREMDKIPVDVLTQYFANSNVSKDLFMVAKELEHLSMKREFTPHTDSSKELRAFLGCLFDFWGVDRKSFSDALKRLD